MDPTRKFHAAVVYIEQFKCITFIYVYGFLNFPYWQIKLFKLQNLNCPYIYVFSRLFQRYSSTIYFHTRVYIFINIIIIIVEGPH